MKIVLALAAVAALWIGAAGKASATPQHATSVVSGTVIDSIDNHPIGGVEVDLFDDTAAAHVARVVASTMTREDGTFSLVGVREGSYHLELVKRGYALEVVTGLSLRSATRVLIAQPFGLRAAVVTTGVGRAMETNL
jgi:carboxypeptidase family protein